MAQWKPTERVASTFTQVFPHVVLLGNQLLIGSNEPIAIHTEALIDQLYSPAVRQWLLPTNRSPEKIRYLIDKIQMLDTRSNTTPNINTDFHPRDEYHLNNR